MLRKMGIKELRSSLSETLAQVKAGDEIVITERGEPIAKLVQVLPEEEAMQELIRKGLMRPPIKPLDVEEFLRMPKLEDPEGLVLAALLDDRRHGR